MAITVAMREQVSQLYVALFGRAPDLEGLGFWAEQVEAGLTLAHVADAMYGTAPARAYYPSALTHGEIVASFYVNVLGREADAQGLAFWTAKLDAAGATPGSVITEMIDVVANYDGTDEAGLLSAALFNNKAAVALYYGEQYGAIAGATAALVGVTADAASVGDTTFGLDASHLVSYKFITFQGAATEVTVDNVAADQVLGINSDSASHLDVTAAGYAAATDTESVVFGGDLKVAMTTWDGAAHGLTAQGNRLSLTLDAGDPLPTGADASGEYGSLEVSGDVRMLNAQLNAEVVTEETGDADAPPGAATDVEQLVLFVSADAGNLANLTTIVVHGVGEAEVSNAHGAKLASIDASALGNISWTDSKLSATGPGLGYATTNDAVAETIKLGAGYDDLAFNFYDNADADRWASSYLHMDKVENFTVVAMDTDATALDFDKSDLISVRTDIAGNASATFEKLGSAAAAAASDAGSIGLALQTVAQNTTKDYVVFQYGGNTYIYGDTGGVSGADLAGAANDQMDDTDLVIQLTGTVNLDLLLQALNPISP